MIRRVRLLRGTPLAAVLALAGCGGGGTTITPPPPPPPPPEIITITTNASINYVMGAPLSLTLQETGASGAVTWTVISGQLPAGFSLDSTTGVVSGASTFPGVTQVTISAADAKGNGSKLFSFNAYGKLSILGVTSPPPAHLSVPYSLSFGMANSFVPPLTWSITNGQLPPGLTLLPNQPNIGNALISGTPTVVGTFQFTLQAQDSFPQTATVDLTVVVDSHVVITKSQLNSAEQNQPYSDSFTAINGTPPYHWSLAGQLPNGLSFNASTGQVSGSSTDFGGYPYTVTVTDSSSTPQTDSAQAMLGVIMQLQIFTNLAPAYIETPYFSSFGITGGTPPVTFTVTTGSLPPGLTLLSGGFIQGTPTQLGSFPFTVHVTDSGTPPYVISQNITMNVTATPLQMFGNPITVAPVNVKFHSQVPLSGGTPPYTWSLNSGTLPPGIMLDPTNGFLDGTPAQIGTFNYQFKGTDSSNPRQTATASGFLQVRTPLGRNDSIATATPLGNSQNQQIPLLFSISPYIDPIDAASPNPDTDYFRLVATGGSIVHVGTFAQTAALDTVIELLDQNGARLQNCAQPGYTSPCLNDDVDSTTVNSALDFKVPGASSVTSTIYLHVLDWRGDARPDMTYFLNISGVIEPLVIAPKDIGPGATRGVSYQLQFTTSGGTGNVTWALDSGPLPPGWSISLSGLLSGIATTDGSYTFTIKATDSANPPQVARATYTQRIAEPLVITSSPVFPTGCVNKPYSFQVTTSGGLAPVFFSFFSSSWTTIGLDTSTGVFSGTPNSAGTFTGSLGAGDSANPPSGQGQTVSLTVNNCP